MCCKRDWLGLVSVCSHVLVLMCCKQQGTTKTPITHWELTYNLYNAAGAHRDVLPGLRGPGCGAAPPIQIMVHGAIVGPTTTTPPPWPLPFPLPCPTPGGGAGAGAGAGAGGAGGSSGDRGGAAASDAAGLALLQILKLPSALECKRHMATRRSPVGC